MRAKEFNQLLGSVRQAGKIRRGRMKPSRAMRMKEPYLEVTYRRGRPTAAYYYLPRSRGDKSHRTAQMKPGLVVDFNRSGRPIGIEITAPSRVSPDAVNRALKELGLPEAKPKDLAPLRAA